MGKIKTPLMTAIENIKSLKALAEKRDKGSSWDHRIIQMDNDIKMLESLLPTERDMIEKVFKDGGNNTYCCSHDYHEDQGDYEYILNSEIEPKDYFTQTFDV